MQHQTECKGTPGREAAREYSRSSFGYGEHVDETFDTDKDDSADRAYGFSMLMSPLNVVALM
jgi:hypothetical protein